ncbi:MAG: SCO family protein [Pseudomonadota bacterium]
MTKQNRIVKMLAFLLTGALALAAGAVLWLQLSGPAAPPPVDSGMKTRSATVLPQLKTLPHFSLTDQHGRPFTNENLQGRWTFLSFGYTHCPDICPTTLAMLTAMEKQLQASAGSIPYQIVFVSIDPERDTQQRLAEYIAYFNPEFLGVTGDDSALQRLTQPLGILYAKVTTEKSAMEYVMDHSASIILVDPQGRYHALFSPPHEAVSMAQDFITITTTNTEEK